jgi:hypothetical protein
VLRDLSGGPFNAQKFSEPLMIIEHQIVGGFVQQQ